MSGAVIIDKILNVPLVNEFGSFFVGAYKILTKHNTIIEVPVLYCGDLSSTVNVRVNSACFTGDIFHCRRCDCNYQLIETMKYIQEKDNGLIIYLLNQDGRGCGTVEKIKSLLLMDQEGFTTKQAFEYLNIDVDNREYDVAAIILKDLCIKKINLITNNPVKISALEKEGISVIDRIPSVSQSPDLKQYLNSKIIDFNHMIEW